MIKGSQKQLIVLRTGRSRYFDEAYFVLRREIRAGRECHGDILSEANRILEENTPRAKGGARRRWLSILFFVIGMILGATLAVAAILIL